MFSQALRKLNLNVIWENVLTVVRLISFKHLCILDDDSVYRVSMPNQAKAPHRGGLRKRALCTKERIVIINQGSQNRSI